MTGNWRELKRHPLSQEYRDITGPAWYSFTLKMRRIGYLSRLPIIIHDGMVLDGWQRLRSCIELDIEPSTDTLPEGNDPRGYVETVNDERRHETADERSVRIAARRERVAESRMEGESLRTIAEKEGVSEMTVRNDLKDSTAKGFAVEPPDGKVMGRDKKERPATKPKPPQPSPPKQPDEDDDAVLDSEGIPVSTKLRPVFAAAYLFRSAALACAKAAIAVKAVEESMAYRKAHGDDLEGRRVYSTVFRAAEKKMIGLEPMLPCCEDKACAKCNGIGFLTRGDQP